MSFALTSDQDLIRKTVAEFADAELTPRKVEELDRAREFPRDALRKMAGLGLFGMLVPADEGGAGTDTVSYCLAVEEVAARSGAVGVVLAQLNALGTLPLASHGSDDVKRRWLAPLVAGEKLSAWALTEPNAGSDLSNVATTATKDGDDYVLNGLKSFVVGALDADVLLVFARTPAGDADADGEKAGLTLFLVPKDAAGVRVGRPEASMTLRAATMAQVFLKDVRVPAADRVGDEGQGLEIALRSLEANRLGMAAAAVGLMRAAIREAKEFASQRVQFRMPIKQFQGIQWKAVDMDVDARAARLLTLFAASRRDAGDAFADDAAAAKLFASERAARVTQQGIRIHGGVGFMREMPAERLNRDARSLAVVGGTSEVQRAALASKLLDV